MKMKMKMRRGASRFARQMKPQQQSAAGGGDSVAPEKSKKGRIRRLSAVNRATSSSLEASSPLTMMGKRNNGDVCDRDEQQQFPSSSSAPPVSGNYTNRFKVPRKLLDGCNGATVPRKLRSAMKKRSRESLSPPQPGSQKLNPATGGGEESVKGSGFKRSRLDLKQESSGSITKDEEEVAETLHALAGMFPDNNNSTVNKAKLQNAPPDGHEKKPSALKEGSSKILEPAIQEDLKSIFGSRGKFHEDTVDICSWKIPRVGKLPDICNGRTLAEKIVNLVGQVNMDTTTLVAKPEKQKKNLVCNSANVLIPLEPVLDTEKKKAPPKSEHWLLGGKMQVSLELTTARGLQLDKQLPVREEKKNGLALWPGLSLSNGASSSHSPSLQWSSAKLPAWLDAAVSTSRPVAPSLKVSDRRSWRRSTTHVCISRLIQTLQTSEGKDNPPPARVEYNETLKSGVPMTLNELQGMRKGFTEVASTSANEAAREGIILQQRRIHYEQSNPALLPLGTYGSQKQQSFNFMSFLQAKNSFNGATGQQAQLHPTTTYLGRPLYAPHNVTTQQLLQHHHQQQAQAQQSQFLMAAQYRASAGASSPAAIMTHLSTLQNKKQDTTPAGAATAMPAYVRAIIPPQDHQIHARVRRQDGVFPSGYEQGGGRGVFRANGAAAALPLQLLCNERL